MSVVPISVSSEGLLGGANSVTIATLGFISALGLAQPMTSAAGVGFDRERILEDDRIIMSIIMKFIEEIAREFS